MREKGASEPRIFRAAAALVILLSVSAMVLAGIRAPRLAAHRPLAGVKGTASHPHKGGSHPAPWLVDATMRIVNIAGRLAG